MVKYLHERGKKRRQRITHRRGRFKQAAPIVRTIEERPSDITIGDFEGDLVVSKRKGKGGVLSLRNRKTKKHTFISIPDLKAKTVKYCLIIFLMKLGKDLKITLTLDRGSEFAFSELSELERLFPLLKIYYCDAYCPYQKGSVENGHRGFRWFFPKGTDFSLVSQAQITDVENILNNKPMKLHDFKSPNFMWELEYKIAA